MPHGPSPLRRARRRGHDRRRQAPARHRQRPSIGLAARRPRTSSASPCGTSTPGTVLCRVTTSGFGPWWFSSDAPRAVRPRPAPGHLLPGRRRGRRPCSRCSARSPSSAPAGPARLSMWHLGLPRPVQRGRHHRPGGPGLRRDRRAGQHDPLRPAPARGPPPSPRPATRACATGCATTRAAAGPSRCSARRASAAGPAAAASRWASGCWPASAEETGVQVAPVPAAADLGEVWD